ncbi:Cysteine-rich secretory protein family protein [compost metagenome]
MTDKQVTPKQARIATHGHTNAPTPIITQASSTATSNSGREAITIQEAPNGIPSYLLDLIGTTNGNPLNQSPAGNPVNQAPVGNPVNPTPIGNPGNQANPGVNAPSNPAGQAQQGNQNSTQFAQQVLDIVNQERSKAGLGALSMSAELSKMAMVKAQDMYTNNYFDHNSPTHGSPFDMMKAFGITYNTAGENIAKGQNTPTQVMNDWMNSPGHKANILNSSFTQIGIAYYNSEWVQEFTG